MRRRSVLFPLVLVPTVLGTSSVASAMGSHEGTFEYAIDAPWRIEPVMDAGGHATYGAIPITLTIDDENAIPMDAPGRKLGNFCEMVVAGPGGNRHISLRDLAEIEMTGNGSTTYLDGAWQPGAQPPPHQACVPSASNACEGMRSIHGTSEWHATAWYEPYGTKMTSGQDVSLDVDVRITRDPQISCSSATAGNIITLRNHLLVHAGEAPLPRFDNRWVYGDLHYHSQGTDNEGEAGYSYRSTLRAMGAMGMDFVIASEHASDSTQIGDIDFHYTDLGPTAGGGTLRDMDAQRFAFLHGLLWGSAGANRTDAFDGGFGKPSQNAQSRGTAPQIYLGGEVDAIPELPANWAPDRKFPYGNNLMWDINGGCGGWYSFKGIDACPNEYITRQVDGVSILQDVQGFREMHPSRAHLVYLPADGNDPGAFVSSKTGKFGGGGRRLVSTFEGLGGVLPDIESHAGAAFLAHPIPGGTCDGKEPSASGGLGPDVVPYTQQMLDLAFASKAVVGLEFWNEDARRGNAPGEGETAEVGYDRESTNGISNVEPSGFAAGLFELKPWASMANHTFARTCTGIEWTLHHGAKEWDVMNVKGLTPGQTASLAWLPAGEPRRVFGAGGSDAHGDLNYHRFGYATGFSGADDMAIGKPRNLVFAGNLDGNGSLTLAQGALDHIGRIDGSGAITFPGTVPAGVHSQGQIANALKSGAFSMTDGPAVRIAIDRNHNGVIDDGDTPMGGVAELYGEKTLRVVVEWQSTPEWGIVDHVDLVVGGARTVGGRNGLWAPANNGPRTASTPDVGYSSDPTGGKLRFAAGSLAGHTVVDLPLTSFMLVGYPADRLFVRAFAETRPSQGVKRYGFTNPVWAISPPIAAGTCPTDRPRAIDQDADGLPDGCDPCPFIAGSTCTILLPPGGVGRVE